MTYVHAQTARTAEAHTGLFTRLTEALQDRRARAELAELPPHLLRDVGLVDQVRHTDDTRSLVAEVERTLQSTGASW